MKNLHGLLILALAFTFLLPVPAAAQHWTAEEQEVIDHVRTTLDTLVKHGEVDIDVWMELVPDETFFWWFTTDPVPTHLENIPAVFEQFRGARYLWADVKPVTVKVHGDVALIGYYSSIGFVDSNGESRLLQDKRLEVLRKVDGQWRFFGSMVSDGA